MKSFRKPIREMKTNRILRQTTIVMMEIIIIITIIIYYKLSAGHRNMHPKNWEYKLTAVFKVLCEIY
jgi:hypothetical protein